MQSNGLGDRIIMIANLYEFIVMLKMSHSFIYFGNWVLLNWSQVCTKETIFLFSKQIFVNLNFITNKLIPGQEIECIKLNLTYCDNYLTFHCSETLIYAVQITQFVLYLVWLCVCTNTPWTPGIPQFCSCIPTSCQYAIYFRWVFNCSNCIVMTSNYSLCTTQ